MRLLDHKVCVITGSTKGIGLAMARLFSRHGARVVINGRSAEPCKRVAQEITSAGGEAIDGVTGRGGGAFRF